MIDITREQAISLGDAARLYGSSRGGRPTHISTVLRHITRGTRLPGGEVIRLEGARLGGRWITSVESIQRYIERLTAVSLGDEPCPALPMRTSVRRQRELDRVHRELDKAGIR
jgi:hypothetical protein